MRNDVPAPLSRRLARNRGVISTKALTFTVLIALIFAGSALLTINNGKVHLITGIAITPPTATPTFTPTPFPYLGPIPSAFATTHYEAGMVFPQFGATGYSGADSDWITGLGEIHQQSGAGWVEMPINFYQPSAASTVITSTPDKTPTVQSVTDGIRYAHAHGFKVFLVPFVTVGDVGWIGYVRYATAREYSAWFHSLWNAMEPYVSAGQQAGVDQIAIATECELLEQFAPAADWNWYIAQFRLVYTGTLTYDSNHDILYGTYAIPSWFKNLGLDAIGISLFTQVATTPSRPDPATIVTLWHNKIIPLLDHLSNVIGKPVLLSEVGYRNAADALYKPWLTTTTLPPDPVVQAAAYNAVLVNVTRDPHVLGSFFWAWSFPVYEPNFQPAAESVLKTWYTAIARGA